MNIENIKEPKSDRKICLSVKGLTRVFGFGAHKNVAVDHVNMDLYEGEVVSIVGESGSGKTTLAKMLLGLISPTEGEIYFQGKKRDISSQRKKKRVLEKHPGNLPGSFLFL
jgi:peptide/nickel transport system ATP-binding protein